MSRSISSFSVVRPAPVSNNIVVGYPSTRTDTNQHTSLMMDILPSVLELGVIDLPLLFSTSVFDITVVSIASTVLPQIGLGRWFGGDNWFQVHRGYHDV